LHKLNECLPSCDVSEFVNFVTRDKELTTRWSRLADLVEDREVRVHILLLLLIIVCIENTVMHTRCSALVVKISPILVIERWARS